MTTSAGAFSSDHLPGMALAATAWVGFAVVHSILADLSVKSRVMAWMGPFSSAYRLLYVVIAIVTFIGAGMVTTQQPSASLAWWPTLDQPWRGYFDMALGLLILACIIQTGFFDFFGMKQVFQALRGKSSAQQDAAASVTIGDGLDTTGFYRVARHPMYVFAIAQVAMQPMTDVSLVTSGVIVAYFVLGSRIEEQKFLMLFGDDYRTFRERVPAFLFFLRPSWFQRSAP